MTDDEQFAAICADFPFDSAALMGLYERLYALHVKTFSSIERDGTVDEANALRLRGLMRAVQAMFTAVRDIETDADPFDDIPF